MPNSDELKVWAWGGHNAQALAAQLLAARLKMTIYEARQRLLEATRGQS